MLETNKKLNTKNNKSFFEEVPTLTEAKCQTMQIARWKAEAAARPGSRPGGESHACEEAAQAGRRAAKGRRPRPGGSALLTGGCGGRRPGRPAPGTLLGRTTTGSISAARSLHSLHPTAPSGGVAETLASSDTTPPTPAQARLPGLRSARRCPAPIQSGCLQRRLIRCERLRG